MSILTKNQLEDASIDVQTLEDTINLPPGQITSRLGATFDNLQKRLNDIGYQPPLVYQGGLSITVANQTVEHQGYVYAPKPSELPFTAASTFDGSKWFIVSRIFELEQPPYEFPLIVSFSNSGYVVDDASSSIREHSIVWHPDKNKYYMVADFVPTASIHHPNTYDTELHLLSSSDLITWVYHGVCVPKGGVGELGEFGVASPSGIAYYNGKIYAAYSARNTAGFTNRSIGIAWSNSDPEVLPWTKGSTAISDTAGEDDDAALLVIPGSNTMHLYHRTTDGGYRIVHCQTDTPENLSSWTVAQGVTVLPPTAAAQELTAAIYYAGRVHLFIMEQGGSQSGTAHLSSSNPSSPDFQQETDNRFVPMIGGLAYSGHISVVVKNGLLKAFSWTVFVSGSRYGVEIRPYKEPEDIKVSGSNPISLKGEANDWFLLPHNNQLNFAGQFSLLFKVNITGQLNSDSDNYHLFYKGTDGNSAANEGTISVTMRGGIYNGINIRLTKSDGSYVNMRPSVSLASELSDGKVVFALTRNSSNVASLWAVYKGKIELITTTTLSYADFGMGLTTNAAIGAAYSGASSAAVPFKGYLHEVAFYNTALSEADIINFAENTVDPEAQYTPEGVGEFAGCRSHYNFSNISGTRVQDLSGYGADLIFQGDSIKSVSSNSKVGVHLERSTTQSIPDSAYTEILFNVISEQIGSMWDGTDLTISESGWYMLSANARLASNLVGIRGLRFYVNNAIFYSAENRDSVQTSGQVTVLEGNTLAYLNKGDVVDVRVVQTSGGALNLESATGTPCLKVIKV